MIVQGIDKVYIYHENTASTEKYGPEKYNSLNTFYALVLSGDLAWLFGK
jgi:hypothetical protein